MAEQQEREVQQEGGVVKPERVVSIDTVLIRRDRGQRRVRAYGLGDSNPWARLERKEAAGVDVTVEREALMLDAAWRVRQGV